MLSGEERLGLMDEKLAVDGSPGAAVLRVSGRNWVSLSSSVEVFLRYFQALAHCIFAALYWPQVK